jgi:hypothetical protein
MFRSTDDGDTWTQQNGGCTALDVNSVVDQPDRSHFCGRGRRGVPINEWTPTNGVTSVADYCPPGGNVWAVATGGIASGGFAYAGTAGGRSISAASDPLPRCGSLETEASPNPSTAALMASPD